MTRPAPTTSWETRSEFLHFVEATDQKDLLAARIGDRLVRRARRDKARILDVGPGTGAVLEKVLHRVPAGVAFVDVVEPDPRNIATLRCNALISGLLRRVDAGGIEDTQLAEMYDLILVLHSLYTIYEADGHDALHDVLAKLIAALQLGGEIVIGVVASATNQVFRLRRRLLGEDVRLLTDVPVRACLNAMGVSFEESMVASTLFLRGSMDGEWVARFAAGSGFLTMLPADAATVVADYLNGEPHSAQGHHTTLASDTQLFWVRRGAGTSTVTSA